MKKYLWIGMCLNDILKKEIVNNGGTILSAALSQDNILLGLEEVLKESFDTINSYNINSYPSYKKAIISEYQWSRGFSSNNINVGFINLQYINIFSKTITLNNAAKKWAIQNKNNDVIIFVYSMHSPFMNAAKTIKHVIPNAKIILIVPDLPQYMDLNMSWLKKSLKYFDWKRIQNLMQSVDKFILYTKHMATFLMLSNNQFQVMEGSINKNDLIPYDIEKDNAHTTIMYSGVLDIKYGINELLQAFSMITNSKYRLWLSGKGNAEDLINEYQKKDDRIIYFGFLPDREDLLKKQKEADILINVRKPDEIASTYCFPSKIFEYMLSGNPVLSCKIPGIPDEYFNYLVEIKDFNPQSIADTITSIAELPYETRRKIGQKSLDFILSHKNNIAQANKIIDFIKGL